MKIRVRERLEDATLLSLKTEEGTTSQEMQVASGSWKKHRDRFSRASRGDTALLIREIKPSETDFSQAIEFLKFNPFKPLTLWKFFTANTRTI